MRIAVIGMGYVGLPLSLQFASSGVEVIGLDIDMAKVESLNAGQCYIQHILTSTLVEHIASQRFRASSDFRETTNVEAVIICVPTPLKKHLEPDISHITNTGRSIAP